MKHNIIAISDGLIVRFYNQHIAMADSLEAAGDIPGAYQETIKILTFLDDLKRLDQVEAMKTRYLGSPVLKEYMAGVDETALKEKAYIDAYWKAFESLKFSYADGMVPSKTMKWWKKQIKGVNQMITGKRDEASILLGERLRDYIWRNAYNYFRSVEGTELYPVAIQYLDIWKMAQPESISAYFFSAKYNALYGRQGKAIDDLHVAVRNGLDDPRLLEEDPVINELSRFPSYQSILQHLWAEQDLEKQE